MSMTEILFFLGEAVCWEKVGGREVKGCVYIDLEIVVWKFVVSCRWNCGLGKLSTILEIKLCSRV
jgi:hypothetical protein